MEFLLFQSFTGCRQFAQRSAEKWSLSIHLGLKRSEEDTTLDHKILLAVGGILCGEIQILSPLLFFCFVSKKDSCGLCFATDRLGCVDPGARTVEPEQVRGLLPSRLVKFSPGWNKISLFAHLTGNDSAPRAGSRHDLKAWSWFPASS